MTPLEFQFDAAIHAYVVDNHLQPHVTGILDAYGITDYAGVPAFVLQRKMHLGSIVHQVTHYMDADGLPADFSIAAVCEEHRASMEAYQISVDDLTGYVDGWLKFLKESDFQCLPGYVERRHVANVNGMMYGMTVDRAGLLRKRHTILDLKCTAGREKSWPIQLSGYRLGLPRPEGVVRWDSAAVWLKPEGTYALLPGGRNYPDRVLERRDEEIFLAALRLTHWKLEELGHA